MPLEHTMTVARLIAATPTAVFDALTDLNRGQQWWAVHHNFTHRDAATLAVGTKFNHRVGLLGLAFELRWTADKVQRPSLLQASGTAPSGGQLVLRARLLRKPNGTLLALDTELGEGVFAGVLGASMLRHVEHEQQKALAALAALVE